MSIYLILPIMLLLTVLMTYVFVQDTHAVTNRLFALFVVTVLLIESAVLIRVTTDNARLAELSAAVTTPLLGLNDLLLIWLIMALFIPHRYAQPMVRRLIGLPYLLATLALTLDIIAGWHYWFNGLERNALGFQVLRTGSNSGAMIALFIISQVIELVMLVAIAARSPQRRGPAITLSVGLLVYLITSSLASQTGLPIWNYIGSLPLYIAFAWATLRYQLFRPSAVALQTAIENLPDGVLVLDMQQRVRYANEAAQRLLMIGEPNGQQSLAAILDQGEFQVVESENESGIERQQIVRGGARELILEGTEAHVLGDRVANTILLLRDITSSEQQKLALKRSSTSLIQRTADLETTLQELQQRDALIVQLALPLIPIADGVLVLPLIGAFNAERSAALLDQLLKQIEMQRAHIVLLDMTGVTAFDHSFADALRQVIGGTRLMGAQMALCGVRPELAQSIVHEEIDLRNVLLFSTLQAGISQVRNEASRLAGASQPRSTLWNAA